MGTDSDRLANNRGQTLEMGKSIEDVEEGEISDSASVDKISKKKKGLSDDSKVGLVSSNEPMRENTRVWTMQDIHKYQVSRNYASGFYNLAWAQAVQNKPLDEVFNNNNNNNNNNSGSSSSNNKTNDEADNGDGVSESVKDKVVIDLSSGDDDDNGEREEGELEEGEIDFNLSDSDVNKSEYNAKDSKKTLEERINGIREAFESVITNDLEESFDTGCSQIKDSLDSLWEVILEESGSNIDELVKLAFKAINTLNIMFGSMRQNQKEQNKNSLSRLFHHVTGQNPPLFATEQIKEIEHMIRSLDSSPQLPSIVDTDKQAKIENVEEAKPTMDFTKLETTSFRSRGKLLPLLDLHKDHHEDSLPSPTRDAPSIIPPGNDVTIRSSIVKPEVAVMPYFETDAINAISTYQQKFGRNSFHMSDLPSPTPSEDGDDKIGENGLEVSSASIGIETANTLNLPRLNDNSSCAMDFSSSVGANTSNMPRFNIPSSCAMDISSIQAVSNVTNLVPVKSSAKSRDPRLRFANKDTVSSRVPNMDFIGETSAKKQKLISESFLNGPIVKRQKNGPTDIGPVNNIVNVMSNGVDHLQAASTSNEFPLDSLLKDIATNPGLYVNLIKMEQQKSMEPITTFTHVSSLSSLTGTTSSPMNITLPKPPVVAQKPAEIVQINPQTAQKPAEIVQITPQTALTDEAEKIRMKPRDPRRALHNNKANKIRNGVPNQIISSTPISTSQEIRVGLNSCNQPDKNIPPLKNSTVPDITRQFTNNLKNIAGTVSVSQTPTPMVSISSSEEVSANPSNSENAWGEVGHLYEGLDEKQKAAFHNERARRIDEQKKMFSARKLCLVLDLDHTLLNSAKFVEVDPVHDEILRKKEEQDREKPHRHLFRFPHMGMWTKLRPGIWNFLEKASKLFEMHLYTMGNKLYATEMAKLLDPKGTLFSGRVISRGDDDDDGDISKSKDLEGVLGMESGVVIIDDSIRVWPHNKLNLIVVERYIFFPCSRRQFGLLGPSLLEIDHDERPEAGTLASSLAVIEKIHQNFFARPSLDEADVRSILASEQRKILGGCRIVFSRVFPVGEASPNLHPLWQTAEQFGAVCTNQIDDQVTHVVAISLGTDKVNWALSTGRFVVHPGWVEASALLYRRANEQDFAIKP